MARALHVISFTVCTFQHSKISRILMFAFFRWMVTTAVTTDISLGTIFLVMAKFLALVAVLHEKPIVNTTNWILSHFEISYKHIMSNKLSFIEETEYHKYNKTNDVLWKKIYHEGYDL